MNDMTSKLPFLSCILATALAGTAIDASAYTINDLYGASYNSTDCSTDHCGGDAYDSAGIDVSLVNHLLTVSVFTNFKEPNASNITYGDLFLTVDGTRYVLDTSSAQGNGTGTAYKVGTGTTLLKAGQVTSVAGRPNQEVLYASGGTAVGSFNFGVSAATGLLSSLSYSILDSAVGLSSAALHSVDLLWAMSCGNDVVNGTVALDTRVPVRPNAVPLPGTGALVVAGAIGLATMRRRALSPVKRLFGR